MHRGLNVSIVSPLLHLTHSCTYLLDTLTSDRFQSIWKALYLNHLRPYFFGDQPGEMGPFNSSAPGHGAPPNGGWTGLVDSIGAYKTVVLAVARLFDCERCLRTGGARKTNKEIGALIFERVTDGKNTSESSLEEKPNIVVLRLDALLKNGWQERCLCCELKLQRDVVKGWKCTECERCETRYGDRRICEYDCELDKVFCSFTNEFLFEDHGCRVCGRSLGGNQMLSSGIMYHDDDDSVFEAMEERGYVRWDTVVGEYFTDSDDGNEESGSAGNND